MRFGRASALGLAAGALVLVGCSTPALRSAPEAPRGRDLVRPDAPPEYDVLVAQQLVVDGRTAEAVDAYLRAVAKDPDSAYLHRKVAGALAQHNRRAEALEHAKRAVELEPEDVPSRVFLAQLYRFQRESVESEHLLVDESGAPLSSDAAMLLYQIQLEEERYEDALETSRWLIREEPESLRGLLAEANAYQRMGEPERAERALRTALRQEPGNLRIYGALARMLRQREDFEGEARLYREVLDIYPRHHATLVALGEAQLALDDLEGAILTFEEVERRYPDDLDSVKRLGFLYFEARRQEEATAHFRQVLEQSPTEYEVAFFLGISLRRSGDVDLAREAFELVPEEHRYYSDARAQIAAIHERRGDSTAALEEVRRAKRARPSRELELYEATLRAKSGEFDAAVLQMETLIAEHPDDDELLFNLGIVYGEADQMPEAISTMRRVLELNPDNASALNYIGYSWAEQGENLDEAEQMIRRAIELRPEDGYIVDSLGWVYYMRARPLVESGRTREARPYIDRAIEQLERAHELTGGDPVISEHLGDTYLLIDEKARALEKFEEAIRLEPRQGEQPTLIEKLETLQKELQ